MMNTFDWASYKAGQAETIYFFKQIADEYTPEEVVITIRQVFDKVLQNPVPYVEDADSGDADNDALLAD
jgi:hypothetical protein